MTTQPATTTKADKEELRAFFRLFKSHLHAACGEKTNFGRVQLIALINTSLLEASLDYYAPTEGEAK
jgi:hypothetical protein